ncbi:bifunctional folylpolyglutamate synthase/dihydrofolate synthase [Lacrimispora saccharolytica]|uniref:tetrahydrofolate synthase n=1 Tax=Lacrimispora saccharolytica (strain ATCC 35040 / DSM 2544 / NRCC 2533 / WM1) TaxID=610130 RepID=D9R7M5_LACSW|nr:folylpolyglutamate synthase/dihydrofolate synthase family protein [Lacrimispora saccharolytica]ADL03754.1 FolC bifunctional protein [[Clostridium] saccharolyticum WM1]QRV18115.1 bifunctional folylpolyglutamate synthase/dihydrofolate synthase [Lacrimispora saccharolytica]
MDITEAIEYINQTAWQGSRLGLERMEILLGLIWNPERKLKYIHIAGTNGKGSTAAMLASVLTEAGYKTGLYTSPYIQCFNERIQINGINIPDDKIIEAVEHIRGFVDQMEDKPTEFELITVIAFLYFYQCQCDIVVLEVGMGGRLDSTNIIPVPEVAVITAIDLDHTRELGNTVEKIAGEKAGIIKNGCDVVLYQQRQSVFEVIESVCSDKSARLHPVDFNYIEIICSDLNGQCLNFEDFHDIKISLLGEYQQKNTAVALKTLEILIKKGWNFTVRGIKEGMKKAKWPGRFEVLTRKPYFIVDGAHNPNGVRAMADNINAYFKDRKIIFLVGVLKDKDYEAMMRLIMPYGSKFIVVQPENSRALSQGELADYLRNNSNADVSEADNVETGIKTALNLAREDEVIIAFGSLYMVGSIRNFFLQD